MCVAGEKVLMFFFPPKNYEMRLGRWCEVDLVNVPVPVWVQYITSTGIAFNASTGNVPCRYWFILVQY